MTTGGLYLINMPSNEGRSDVDFLRVIASPGLSLFPPPPLSSRPKVRHVGQVEPGSRGGCAADACGALLQSGGACANVEGNMRGSVME